MSHTDDYTPTLQDLKVISGILGPHSWEINPEYVGYPTQLEAAEFCAQQVDNDHVRVVNVTTGDNFGNNYFIKKGDNGSLGFYTEQFQYPERGCPVVSTALPPGKYVIIRKRETPVPITRYNYEDFSNIFIVDTRGEGTNRAIQKKPEGKWLDCDIQLIIQAWNLHWPVYSYPHLRVKTPLKSETPGPCSSQVTQGQSSSEFVPPGES